MKTAKEMMDMNAEEIREYALAEFGIEETDFGIDWNVEDTNTIENQVAAFDRVIEFMEFNSIEFPAEKKAVKKVSLSPLQKAVMAKIKAECSFELFDYVEVKGMKKQVMHRTLRLMRDKGIIKEVRAPYVFGGYVYTVV